MTPGNSVQLQAVIDITAHGETASSAGTATLICISGGRYLLVPTDLSQQQESFSLDEAEAVLASRYALPMASREELSADGAAAIRARESRERVAHREAATKAAVSAATEEWYREQALLALELGLTLEQWQRIVDLLSKPPPKLIAGHLVTNSVTIGRAIVLDEAVKKAVSDPLYQSVKAAAEGASKQGEKAKKKREKGLNQDNWAGRDVTEMIPALQKQVEEAEERAALQLHKKEQAAYNQKERQAERVRVACAHLVGGRAQGDAAHLSIADLVALVRWKGGEVPANTKKENKSELVDAWNALKVGMEVIRAEAATTATTTNATRTNSAATKNPKTPNVSYSEGSEDEDEDEDEDDGGNDDDCSDKEESEDEEDMWNVERIVGERRKGNKLEYQVEWEGEDWKGQLTWGTFNDGGVIFVDDNLLGTTEVLDWKIFQFDTQGFKDGGSAGQNRQVFHHRFSAITVTWSLNSTAGEGSSKSVDHQSREGFAIDIFSNDQQWFVLLNNGFENRNNFLNVADFLFEDQDVCVFEHTFHA